MRLPRRVPWSSTAELEAICSWIYTDENDLESKSLAINRLSAWKAITHLPHALESTLSLLAVITQDQTPHSHLSLRQSYSAAIIRLVNGLVDPLQHGAYARSIASIANQLGLPPWLVELRHAATHEDLPSIELLREAARESMSWLLHNYFLLALNPSSVAEPQKPPLRPIMPMLKQYKSFLKIITRDASLKSQYKIAISTITKDVEKWIAEAKVAAKVAVGEIGWESGTPENLLDSGEVDVKERWALEKLCDALLQKGVLVPLSKKKRDFPIGSFSPPKFSLLLWSSLLRHLHSVYSDFLVVLANRIVSHLLTDNDSLKTPLENQTDLSYDLCLARWAMWCIDTWDGDESQTDFDLKKEVTVNLMHTIGHSVTDSPQNRKGAIALLESLCSGNSQLETALSMLLQLSAQTQTSEWNPDDMIVMDQRLNSLLSLNSHIDSPVAPLQTNQLTSEASGSISGWRILDESTGWRPCPIGVHCSTSE